MKQDEKQVEEKETIVNLSEGTGKKEHDQEEFDQISREQGIK